MNNKLRIAHISLPFYNGGGLVKYVKDIVNKQINDKNIEYVCVFYTNNYNLIFDNPNIKYKKGDICDLFEINNFNPTTLFEGTRYPELDIENKDLEDVIIEKLDEMKINIVHFHTFHGLTSNIIKRIKENNINIVYTAHDYQPICNRINLLDYRGNYCEYKKELKCSECNNNAISISRLKIRYSKISNLLKENKKIKSKVKKIVTKIQKGRDESQKDNNKSILNLNNELYVKRINVFVNNFNQYVDKIIYSSYITKNIFEDRGISEDKSILIPISNNNLSQSISDYKIDLNKDTIYFGYLGGDRKEKGYELLIKIFNKLSNEGIKNWKLFLLGSGSENISIPNNMKDNVIIKGHVESDLYKDFEVLIIPSIWPETFNFVAIEGIINKKMLISSNIVGSSDLYKESGIILYKYNDEQDFYEKVKEILLNKNKIYNLKFKNKTITEHNTFDRHYFNIMNVYRDTLKDVLYIEIK